MGGVRVVTFNTWCRSWGMEAGAQEGIPTSTVEDRAHLIAKRILDSPQQFDVVCLNEVFDEDAREILEDALPDLKAAEDSGLMMFSRLPFDTMTVPPGFEGVFPGAFPVVTYAPYADNEGLDGFAAKGVVYAKLLGPGGDPLHLLMSHTQADSTSSIGEHRKTRAKQFKQVAELAHKMIGAPPFDEEVLFCGDLNVNGTRNAGGARPEWDMVFDTPGSFLTDELHDVWTHEQRAQDLNNPGKPLPIEDPGMTTHLQRLDYMLRPPDDGSGRRLATQHVAIDYELAQGTTDIPYTSDHLPVRIDLHYRRDHNTAWTAEPIEKAQMAPDFNSPNTLLTERAGAAVHPNRRTGATGGTAADPLRAAIRALLHPGLRPPAQRRDGLSPARPPLRRAQPRGRDFASARSADPWPGAGASAPQPQPSRHAVRRHRLRLVHRHPRPAAARSRQH